MQKIGSKQICQELVYDWLNKEEDWIALRYDDFKKKMMESGLIATQSTIKAKWVRLAGLECFVKQTNPNLYAVDLKSLKWHLGYGPNPYAARDEDDFEDETITWGEQ